MKRSLAWWLAVALIAGCDGLQPSLDDAGIPGGNFGATQGGAQDMSLAREYVASGVIPPPEALLTEGMFSEHDLPLEGPDCPTLLCVRGALGWQEDGGWLQLGLSANVDPATFVRPSSAIVLLVDVSGSMGWTYGEYGTPACVAHDLMMAVIEDFTEGDAIGIATFASDAHLVQDFVPGSNHQQLRDKISELRAGGSTNMEAGLNLTHRMFTESKPGAEQRRVLLLTDAQPNVGAISPGSFLELAGSLATEGIGLTVIGTGIGLNPEVMQSMVNLRGGNGFSVPSAEEVSGFVEDNWPWLACPIACDLRVDASPTGAFTVGESYGFPGETGELCAATVFLSRRRGALVLRLSGGAFEQLGATLELSYTTPGGDPLGQTLQLELPAGAILDPEGRYFEQYSVRKSAALALLVEGMHDAAVRYGGEWEVAVGVMEHAAQRFRVDAEAMIAQGQGDQADLEREIWFAEELLRLMQAGATQVSLYGP